MFATSALVEIYLDLNIVLAASLPIWLALRLAFARSSQSHAFGLQLGVLKALIGLVAASPLLAVGVGAGLDIVAPGTSLAIADLAVAAFLRGDIAMEAIRFESVLNARTDWMRDILSLASPVAVALVALLAIGATVSVLRLAAAILRVRRIIAGSHLVRRVGSVDIRLSETVRTPLAMRLGSQRSVVLPCRLMARPKEVKIAVAHELQHLRQHDVEWELGFEILRPLFFWNPAFVLMKRQFDRLRELSCDQAVVSAGFCTWREYSNCLLRFAGGSGSGPEAGVLNVALVRRGHRRAKRDLTNRLLALPASAALRPGIRPAWLGVAVVASVLSVSLVAGALQPAKDWSLDRLMLSTVVNLERLEAINRGF